MALSTTRRTPKAEGFGGPRMSHFPGRGPPAPPSGLDDSGLDMRAIKQAGGKVLPGERSQIAKNFKAPDGFLAAATARRRLARSPPARVSPDVNPQAATA